MQDLSLIPLKTAVFGSILWIFSYLQISGEVFLILTILMRRILRRLPRVCNPENRVGRELRSMWRGREFQS